jgi:HlyD family secretion protein
MKFTGIVVASAQATLATRMPARVVSVNAQPDQPVHPGEVVIQLDDSDARAQQSTAHAGVLAAEAQLGRALAGRRGQMLKAQTDLDTANNGLITAETRTRQAALGVEAARQADKADLVSAQEGVNKAKAGLNAAQETLRQLQALTKVGGVSQNDLSGAQTQVTIAQSDYDTANAQLNRLQSHPSDSPNSSMRVAAAEQDLVVAQQGVRQAKQGVQNARAAIRETQDIADKDVAAAQAAVRQAQSGESAAVTAGQMSRLVSPIAGIVGTVSVHMGDTAQPGMPLATVVSLASPHIDALVTARQVAQLTVGHAATVTVDTLPGRTFPAAVSSISHVAEPDGRTFRISFRFTGPVTIRPGQTAHVSVAVH